MEKVRPWFGQPSDRGRLENRTGSCQSHKAAYTSKMHLHLALNAAIPLINSQNSHTALDCFINDVRGLTAHSTHYRSFPGRFLQVG